jgi:hypothetical protein
MLAPGLAERSAIQSLATEETSRRLQMGLAFGDAPTGRKRGKQIIPMRRYVIG